MQETIIAPCLGCDAVQELVLCEPCRERYPFMRDWEFERIVRHFMRWRIFRDL